MRKVRTTMQSSSQATSPVDDKGCYSSLGKRRNISKYHKVILLGMIPGSCAIDI